MAYLVVKKIVREHVDLRVDNKGKTFGQMIDKAIGEALNNKEELSEITFGFADEQWYAFADSNDADDYRSASCEPDYGHAVAAKRK